MELLGPIGLFLFAVALAYGGYALLVGPYDKGGRCEKQSGGMYAVIIWLALCVGPSVGMVSVAGLWLLAYLGG